MSVICNCNTFKIFLFYFFELVGFSNIFIFNYMMQLLEIAQVPDEHVSSRSIPLFSPLSISFVILISLQVRNAFIVQNLIVVEG